MWLWRFVRYHPVSMQYYKYMRKNGTDEMLCCGVIAVIHGIIVLRIGEIYTINGDGF